MKSDGPASVERGHGIAMNCPDLAAVPQHVLPPGFSIRSYRPGDERHWLNIHIEADRHGTFTPDYFAGEFGHDRQILAERQLYLGRDDGTIIGTVTAWWGADDRHGPEIGRVHWVAIVPGMQGRGLAKPLFTAVCNRLRELGHTRGYLTTQTFRVPAVNLYLANGFAPEIRGPQDVDAWRQLAPILKRPVELKSEW